jgi:hypothetical protein
MLRERARHAVPLLMQVQQSHLELRCAKSNSRDRF